MRKDSEGYRHNEHSVGLVFVHLVWCPKRRKSVLSINLLQSVAIEKEWVIKAVEVVPERSPFGRIDPKHSVAQVVAHSRGGHQDCLEKNFLIF